jgi:Beta-galactosidase/beta-glucuronidase
MIKRGGRTTDEVSTSFGIRTISWPVKRNDGDGRFFLNGRPVFINGVCEYEHQFGQSHAFSSEQIRARVKEIEGAGFNAFRDAHQPHNIEYLNYWDKDGIFFGLSSRLIYGMIHPNSGEISRKCLDSG